MSYQQYFFSTVNRAAGQAAPDWKQVLESLPGLGFGVNPKPGEVQPPNAKHHGITVMIDAGGNARGRIWLPTDTPTIDHNGNAWFTHEIQVIADGPLPGTMVWAWDSKGGAVPRPFESGEEPSPEPPPVDDALEQRVAALEQQVKRQQAQIDMLADVMPDDEKIERIATEAARAAIAKATVDVRVGSNWGHGHAGSATIRP